MDKVIGFMINNDNFHEITNENTEMLSNIFSEENVKMKEILDRLIYTSVENEHNQKEIIRFKKSILIKQKTDNIKNNLFFTTKFDDFENMEFDFFKNEYSILENTNKMLKTPHELLTARLYQHIVYHRNAPDYLEYLKSKGVDYNYKIISQISMLSQDRIDESFQENSLLLDTITENQIKFHDTSNKNLIKSIKHLFSKTEIINKPGCLTLMNVKENPYISENSNSDILNFLHIKDIQNLLEKYKKKAEESKLNYSLYSIETNKEFKKEFSEIIKNNKEEALKENFETILFKLFIEKKNNRLRYSYYNNEKSVPEKIEYFKNCIQLIKDVDFTISTEQKQSLVEIMINNSQIEDLVLPEGWFKEFGNKEIYKKYLAKDFMHYSKNEIKLYRPDLYEENKEYFINLVKKEPKIMEIAILNTFESLIRDKDLQYKSSQELNTIIKDIFNKNELYSIYTQQFNHSFREPFLNKLKSTLKKEMNIIKNESFYLNLTMFLNNPNFTINNSPSVKKRI